MKQQKQRKDNLELSVIDDRLKDLKIAIKILKLIEKSYDKNYVIALVQSELKKGGD